MQIWHYFIVIKQSKINSIYQQPYSEEWFKSFLQENPSTKINDHYLDYIADTLMWLENGEKGDVSKGIDFYDWNFFYPHQISKFKTLITAWYQVFLNADNKFVLTGNWTTIVGDDNNGYYEKITIDKSEILKQFSELVSLCEIVENDLSLCLFHWGII